MTVVQVADYIGISRPTVYKYTSSRILPFLRIGRRLLFRVAEIDEWMEAHSEKPQLPKRRNLH